MLRFMTACFLLLGWTFYEASGGEQFAPETAAAAPVIAAPVADDAAEGAELAAFSRDDYAAPAIPDAMPVEIVSRAATDLGPVAALPVAPEETAMAEVRPMHQVTGSGVNMRSGPGTSHGVVETLPLGARAEVLGSEGNWSHIRLENGAEGWMSANFLSAV